MLMLDGLHVPVIPFCDVGGKAGGASPLQIARLVPNTNAGVILGFTVTVNVVLLAH